MEMSFYPQRPVSKLSVLFIFAIILPGLILSYFSIQNIRNQKELTEKRIAEEQNKVAGQITEKFQKEINSCATQYFQLFEKTEWNPERIETLRDSASFISRAFLVNLQGHFIIPYYLDDHE
jgi:predicted Holliday junction resolvase-like endonuclease